MSGCTYKHVNYLHSALKLCAYIKLSMDLYSSNTVHRRDSD